MQHEVRIRGAYSLSECRTRLQKKWNHLSVCTNLTECVVYFAVTIFCFQITTRIFINEAQCARGSFPKTVICVSKLGSLVPALFSATVSLSTGTDSSVHTELLVIIIKQVIIKPNWVHSYLTAWQRLSQIKKLKQLRSRQGQRCPETLLAKIHVYWAAFLHPILHAQPESGNSFI